MKCVKTESINLETPAGRADAMFNLESFNGFTNKLSEVGDRITKGIDGVLKEFNTHVKESRDLDTRRAAENERFTQQIGDNALTGERRDVEGNVLNNFQENAENLANAFANSVSQAMLDMVIPLPEMPPPQSQEVNVRFDPILVKFESKEGTQTISLPPLTTQTRPPTDPGFTR